MVLLLLVAGVTACAIHGVARARRQIAGRRAILTPCLVSLTDARPSIAPDGYPRLSGRLGWRRCNLAVIPDTLALRRLPQLWLTIGTTSACALPSLVVTARPRGDDYVSRAFDYPRQIDVPSWLPRDLMIRAGTRPGDREALERLREALVALFSDVLVKELSLGRKGFRLVYRLAEGDRANHLLLRQCRFEASVDATLLDRLMRHLEAFEAAMSGPLAVAA